MAYRPGSAGRLRIADTCAIDLIEERVKRWARRFSRHWKMTGSVDYSVPKESLQVLMAAALFILPTRFASLDSIMRALLTLWPFYTYPKLPRNDPKRDHLKNKIRILADSVEMFFDRLIINDRFAIYAVKIEAMADGQVAGLLRRLRHKLNEILTDPSGFEDFPFASSMTVPFSPAPHRGTDSPEEDRRGGQYRGGGQMVNDEPCVQPPRPQTLPTRCKSTAGSAPAPPPSVPNQEKIGVSDIPTTDCEERPVQDVPSCLPGATPTLSDGENIETFSIESREEGLARDVVDGGIVSTQEASPRDPTLQGSGANNGDTASAVGSEDDAVTEEEGQPRGETIPGTRDMVPEDATTENRGATPDDASPESIGAIPEDIGAICDEISVDSQEATQVVDIALEDCGARTAQDVEVREASDEEAAPQPRWGTRDRAGRSHGPGKKYVIMDTDGTIIELQHAERTMCDEGTGLGEGTAESCPEEPVTVKTEPAELRYFAADVCDTQGVGSEVEIGDVWSESDIQTSSDPAVPLVISDASTEPGDWEAKFINESDGLTRDGGDGPVATPEVMRVDSVMTPVGEPEPARDPQPPPSSEHGPSWKESFKKVVIPPHAKVDHVHTAHVRLSNSESDLIYRRDEEKKQLEKSKKKRRKSRKKYLDIPDLSDAHVGGGQVTPPAHGGDAGEEISAILRRGGPVSAVPAAEKNSKIIPTKKVDHHKKPSLRLACECHRRSVGPGASGGPGVDDNGPRAIPAPSGHPRTKVPAAKARTKRDKITRGNTDGELHGTRSDEGIVRALPVIQHAPDCECAEGGRSAPVEKLRSKKHDPPGGEERANGKKTHHKNRRKEKPGPSPPQRGKSTAGERTHSKSSERRHERPGVKPSPRGPAAGVQQGSTVAVASPLLDDAGSAQGATPVGTARRRELCSTCCGTATSGEGGLVRFDLNSPAMPLGPATLNSAKLPVRMFMKSNYGPHEQQAVWNTLCMVQNWSSAFLPMEDNFFLPAVPQCVPVVKSTTPTATGVSAPCPRCDNPEAASIETVPGEAHGLSGSPAATSLPPSKKDEPVSTSDHRGAQTKSSKFKVVKTDTRKRMKAATDDDSPPLMVTTRSRSAGVNRCGSCGRSSSRDDTSVSADLYLLQSERLSAQRAMARMRSTQRMPLISDGTMTFVPVTEDELPLTRRRNADSRTPGARADCKSPGTDSRQSGDEDDIDDDPDYEPSIRPPHFDDDDDDDDQ